MNFKKENNISDNIDTFPIRQDITVLPADDPEKLRIGFYFHEGDIVLIDGTLFGTKSEEEYEEFFAEGIKIKELKSRLKNFDDIKNGDIIYSTWYDGEPVAMTVEGIEDGKNTALGKIHDGCYGNLFFDNDFRKCWTCGGYMFINPSAVLKLDLEVV